MARFCRNGTLSRGFRSPENTPPFWLQNWRFQGKNLETPRGATTPSGEQHDPVEEFLSTLRALVELAAKLDTTSLTRADRKWAADTVTRLIDAMQLRDTTDTCTLMATQEQEGVPPG